jgi:hypothetical protein
MVLGETLGTSLLALSSRIETSVKIRGVTNNETQQSHN